MIREKHTISGRLLEADIYPIFNDGKKIPSRAPKTKPSTEEQIKYNKKKAEKKAVRLINANFDETDIIMHPTSEQDKAPESEAEMDRIMDNYFRRMKTWRASEAKNVRAQLLRYPDDKTLQKTLAKLEAPFKYWYSRELVPYKTGKKKGMPNWHVHIFMTGAGRDGRDKAEELWKNGMRTNADRFRPEIFGPEAAAKYMCKDPQGKKRFSYSRNLTQPKEPKPKDGKLTRNTVSKMAAERIDDKAYWEKKYKGYRFIRCYPKFNSYNGNWYISTVMYKADGSAAPEWSAEDWNTEGGY
jgi:hypothetical protein